ncbi:MAG: polynucleotide adenylyltransferase PcnB, partial [Treponema sp.]|nr:polynucleotide adenylyltransferase PcnB [Treponema sp.]
DSLVKSEPESRLGKRLTYLVYDFISSLTDWKKEVSTKSAAGELYTRTWSQCRHFVLPMNPQRTELEYAIKNTLTQLGVGVRIGKKKVSK